MLIYFLKELQRIQKFPLQISKLCQIATNFTFSTNLKIFCIAWLRNHVLIILMEKKLEPNICCMHTTQEFYQNTKFSPARSQKSHLKQDYQLITIHNDVQQIDQHTETTSLEFYRKKFGINILHKTFQKNAKFSPVDVRGLSHIEFYRKKFGINILHKTFQKNAKFSPVDVRGLSHIEFYRKKFGINILHKTFQKNAKISPVDVRGLSHIENVTFGTTQLFVLVQLLSFQLLSNHYLLSSPDSLYTNQRIVAQIRAILQLVHKNFAQNFTTN
eukprot:TRINITY_DN6149_c0_g2_i6.p3 TRINITY_DN6149_c0_g2~~TRINITY_DN6149_c0_g2_i6.p3  ORF type:complete len:272 (+),score=-15.58 TRINITY_DN6149_c0_g2_i6:1219-2034(+)